jgi:hypothetical protein
MVLGIAAMAAIGLTTELSSKARDEVYTPGNGSSERRAILSAVRPRVEKDLGAPVEFVVGTMRVSGDHAFVTLQPQRPGGGEIKPEETPIGRQMIRDEGNIYLFDCCHTEALLSRKRGVWRIDEIGIGATDVWWQELCKSRPKGLCTDPYAENEPAE